MKILPAFIAICIVANCYAAIGQTCTDESECDAGECCQILSEFMVVSKRLLLLETLPPVLKTGTCQRYKTEGESCDGFEKANGYCGCGPGLHCHSYEVQLPAPSKRKRDMRPSRPGYEWISQCEIQPIEVS